MAEDRFHGPARDFQAESRLGKQLPQFQGKDGKPVDVVYVDGENADGKLRAAMNDPNGKPVVIVISASDFDEGYFKRLFEDKRKKLCETPLTEFVQEKMNVPPEVCNCEFTPYDDGDTDESYHYKRLCTFCGNSWFGLHCPHDGHQRPCPNCGKRPIPVPTK